MGEINLFDQLDQAPIFVVGAARSGTTWVFDILTTHPKVSGVFESWLFTPKDGLQALFTSAHWPPKRSGLGNLIKRDELLSYTRDMASRIMSRALKPEHRFLVEKSPSHLFAMPFINEVFPGARFIHVLRDGRDVSVSVRAAAKSWVPSWEETFGRSIKVSARAWKHAVRRAQNEGKKLGERYLEIRYENIHKDPFSAYRRLFDFCKISYDDDILQTVFDTTDFKKNFTAKDSSFRRGGRVGDWRTQFRLIDKFMFNLSSGKMLMDLGYEKNRWWWLTTR